MSTIQKNLCEDLLENLSQYNTIYSYGQIEELFVSWGSKLVEMGLHSHPRAVSRLFWRKLQSMELDPSTSERLKDRDNTIDHPNPILFDVDKWVIELMKYPIDEAVNAFTEAVYAWLHKCDLSCFRKENDSEMKVMLAIQKFWFYSWIL